MLEILGIDFLKRNSQFIKTILNFQMHHLFSPYDGNNWHVLPCDIYV